MNYNIYLCYVICQSCTYVTVKGYKLYHKDSHGGGGHVSCLGQMGVNVDRCRFVVMMDSSTPQQIFLLSTSSIICQDVCLCQFTNITHCLSVFGRYLGNLFKSFHGASIQFMVLIKLFLLKIEFSSEKFEQTRNRKFYPYCIIRD